MKKVLSFDIGGTSIKYGVVDFNGDVVWKDAMDTEAHLGGEHLVGKLMKKISEVASKEQIEGVAISTAGIVDSGKGEIVAASNAIPNYQGQKIKEAIERAFELKTTVENDVNCAALGELWKGAGKDYKDIFCVTLGTGVGGCVISDKKVLNGPTFSAGEVGFLQIGGERLNESGSTLGLITRVAARKNIEPSEIDGKMIFDLAFSGDTICIEEIDRMVDSVAELISIIAYVNNPEAIILGGGVIKQKEYLLPRFTEKAKERIIPFVADKLDIKVAELENDAGMVGAVYYFLQQL